MSTLLQGALRVLVLEAEEFQEHWILDLLFWCHLVSVQALLTLFLQRCLFAREGHAFIELAGNLAVELAN
jgi:hypothetical protein